MTALSMSLTPERYDDVLENMEDCFCELEVAQANGIWLPKAESNLLGHVEVAHDFMKTLVQLPDPRSDLENIFGKDCARISRTRAVLEATKFSDANAGDQRLSTCLSACQSVERALQDLGLGLTLQRAQQCQREVIKRQASTAQPFQETPRLEKQESGSVGITVIDLMGERESFLKMKAEIGRPEPTSAEAVMGEELQHVEPKSSWPSLPWLLEPVQPLQTESAESPQQAHQAPPQQSSSFLPSFSWKQAPSAASEQQSSKISWPNLLERPYPSPCSKPVDGSVKVVPNSPRKQLGKVSGCSPKTPSDSPRSSMSSASHLAEVHRHPHAHSCPGHVQTGCKKLDMQVKSPRRSMSPARQSDPSQVNPLRKSMFGQSDRLPVTSARRSDPLQMNDLRQSMPPIGQADRQADRLQASTPRRSTSPLQRSDTLQASASQRSTFPGRQPATCQVSSPRPSKSPGRQRTSKPTGTQQVSASPRSTCHTPKIPVSNDMIASPRSTCNTPKFPVSNDVIASPLSTCNTPKFPNSYTAPPRSPRPDAREIQATPRSPRIETRTHLGHTRNLSGLMKALLPCPNCGRTFLPDRLDEHMKGCRSKSGRMLNFAANSAQVASAHHSQRQSIASMVTRGQSPSRASTRMPSPTPQMRSSRASAGTPSSGSMRFLAVPQ